MFVMVSVYQRHFGFAMDSVLMIYFGFPKASVSAFVTPLMFAMTSFYQRHFGFGTGFGFVFQFVNHSG